MGLDSKVGRARMSANEGLLALEGEGDVLAAFTNRGGFVNASPVTQTTPVALTDIMAVVLQRRASGFFMFNATIGWTGVNTDTYQFALRHYVQAAVPVLSNATSAGPGTNAFLATASGAITIAGSPGPASDVTTGQIETITGELTQQMTLAITLGGAVPENDYAVFVLSVSASGGNFVPVAGSAAMFAMELP